MLNEHPTKPPVYPYDGYNLSNEERTTFDIAIAARARRNTQVNNYFRNGNEFVIDVEGTGTEFRIPSVWYSYFIKIMCLNGYTTEEQEIVYDGDLYDTKVYDHDKAQKVWGQVDVINVQFVGNDEDYAYIIVTVGNTVTNPRFIIKYTDNPNLIGN